MTEPRATGQDPPKSGSAKAKRGHKNSRHMRDQTAWGWLSWTIRHSAGRFRMSTTAELPGGVAAIESAPVHRVPETFAAAYLAGASPTRGVHGLRAMSVFQAPAFSVMRIARR
jgi:hypothetical protein